MGKIAERYFASGLSLRGYSKYGRLCKKVKTECDEKRFAELAKQLNIINSPEYDEMDDAISDMISEVEECAFLHGFKCGVRFLFASLK